MVAKAVEQLKEQMHTEMAQKLTATDAVMKDNIGKMVRSRVSIAFTFHGIMSGSRIINYL